MGESAADPDAPTQLGEAEPETQSVRAWGLDEFDYDDAPTSRLTTGRITGAAVAASLATAAIVATLAWQHFGGQESPVAASPTSVTPVAAPPARPDTGGWGISVATVPPPTKTVTVEKSPMAIPADMLVALDRRFIASLLSQGWNLPDTAASALRAHQVCAEFQQHWSMDQIKAKLAAEAAANGVSNPYVAADQFAYTALQTYPDCERR